MESELTCSTNPYSCGSKTRTAFLTRKDQRHGGSQMHSEHLQHPNPEEFILNHRLTGFTRRFPNAWRYLAFPLVCLLAFFCCNPAIAQTIGTGAIQGTVSDSQGAVVSGAVVTAVDPKNGYTAKQTTSHAGTYRISMLPPSTYNVTVSAPGFSKAVQSNVAVDAMQIVGLNLNLAIGSMQTSVNVSALPPQLDTSDGSLEVTMSNEAYTALPLEMNGGPKNPLGFVTLLPGAQGGNFGIDNLNGGVGQSSFLYINGMPVVTSELQGDARNIKTQTSTEVVDQFQVITSGVPAYYQGSGVTNLIMKSGTNRFHGDIYENVRNTVFDAAGYFASKTPVEQQNEFGASLGGPIIKNKLFFFFNYDGYRFKQGANPSYYNLPTAAERTGDFSALLPLGEIIYDPATTQCNANGVCTRQPFPGNIIPSNRISSVSKNLESFLPPTINNNLQDNFLGFLTGGVDQNMYSVNVDYQPFQSNHLTTLFQHGSNPPVGLPPNGGPQLPLPYTSSRYGETIVTVAQITDADTITQHLVNDFGFQFNRFETPFTNPTTSGDYAEKAGLLNLPVGEPQTEFPPVSFGGPESPTFWAGNNFTQSFSEAANTFTTQDNLAWNKGQHNLTFGVQYVKEQENTSFPNVNSGFNFSNNETAGFTPEGTINETTGNSYASYLLGEVNSIGITDTTVLTTGARYSSFSAYVQDDWKVNPSLLINAGLRYDIPKPFEEVLNRVSWMNATQPNPEVEGYPGALQFAGNGTDSCGGCRTPVKTDYKEFSPRIGFSYSLNPKMVLRGSFTLMHYKAGALGGNANSQGTGLLGFSASPTAVSPNNGITPAYQWNNPFPAYTPPPFFDPTLNTGYNTTTGPTGGGITYPRPNTGGIMPTTYYWNVTFEQQLTPTTVLSISYAGNLSNRIPTPGGYGIYSDQLNPKYMALGNLLQATASPTTLAEAQAIMPGLQLPYSNFSGSIGQMLRPFPQYAGVGDPYADFSHANYNSLQVYAQKTMSKGLLFLLSYTWSQELDDSGANVIEILGAPRSAYNLTQEYSKDVGNSPQVISLSYVYQLPFGRGRAVGTNMSRTLDAVVGGWQLSGIDNYSAGTPLGPIGAACDVPYTGGCYANYNPNFTGRVRINGAYGSGSPKGVGGAPTTYINVNAFENPEPFTFGNTPRTAPFDLHNPWSLNEDLAVQKVFALPKAMQLSLQADAFNLFNRTIYGGISTNITATNFGEVTGQANAPRQLQFEAYFRF